MVALRSPKPPPQRSRSFQKVTPEELCYQTPSVNSKGQMMSNDQKIALREKHGWLLCQLSRPSSTLLRDQKESIESIIPQKGSPQCQRRMPEWGLFEMQSPTGHKTTKHCQSSIIRVSPATRIGQKQMRKDLSNGSVALSQSRLDLFRASQSRMGRDQPPQIIRENSTHSMGSLGTVATAGSIDSLASNVSPHCLKCESATFSISCSNYSKGSATHDLFVHTANSTASAAPPPDPPVVDQCSPSCYSWRSKHSTETQRPSFVHPGSPSQTSLSSTCPESSNHGDISRQMSFSSLNETTLDSSEGQSFCRNLTRISSRHSASDVTSSGSLAATTIKEEELKDEQAAKILIELFEYFRRQSNYEDLVAQLEVSLHTGSKEVQIVCLDWIVKICSKGSENYRENKANLLDPSKVARLAGAIVYAMKEFEDSRELQLHAARTIAVLVANNKLARPSMVAEGACKMLVDCLRSFKDDVAIVEPTIRALMSLSFARCSREALKAVTATKHVCQAMGKHLSLASLQLDGCKLLQNIHINEHEEMSVVTDNVMIAIYHALLEHRGEEEFARQLCIILYNLVVVPDSEANTSEAANETKNASIMRRATNDKVFDLFLHADDCSNHVVGFEEADEIFWCLQTAPLEPSAEMESPVKEATTTALKASNLEEEEALHQLHMQVAMKDRLPAAITDIALIMKRHCASSHIMNECLCLLRSLAVESREHLDAVRKVGFNELVDTINGHTESREVMEQACGLLGTLAKDDACHNALCNAGAITALITFLEKNAGDGNAVELALSTLQALLSAVHEWNEKKEGLCVIREVMTVQNENKAVLFMGNAILSKFEEE